MVTQDTAHERAMAAVAGALDLVRQVGRLGRRPAQHVLGNVGRFTYLLIDLARGLAEWRGLFSHPPSPPPSTPDYSLLHREHKNLCCPAPRPPCHSPIVP